MAAAAWQAVAAAAAAAPARWPGRHPRRSPAPPSRGAGVVATSPSRSGSTSYAPTPALWRGKSGMPKRVGLSRPPVRRGHRRHPSPCPRPDPGPAGPPAAADGSPRSPCSSAREPWLHKRKQAWGGTRKPGFRPCPGSCNAQGVRLGLVRLEPKWLRTITRCLDMTRVCSQASLKQVSSISSLLLSPGSFTKSRKSGSSPS